MIFGGGFHEREKDIHCNWIRTGRSNVNKYTIHLYKFVKKVSQNLTKINKGSTNMLKSGLKHYLHPGFTIVQIILVPRSQECPSSTPK